MNQGLKHLSHEAEYVAITTVALVFLSFVIFPLFIAFLPVALLIGCSFVWNADNLKDKR